MVLKIKILTASVSPLDFLYMKACFRFVNYFKEVIFLQQVLTVTTVRT